MKAFFQRNPTFRRALTNILFCTLSYHPDLQDYGKDGTSPGQARLFGSFPKVPSPSQQKSNWSNLVNAGQRVRVFEPSEWGGAKAVTKKSHSRLLVDITCKLGTSSFRGLQSSMSPATSSSSVSNLRSPFSGLIICVTGLSKGAKAVTKKSHSRLLVDITCKLGTSSFRGLQSSMSPATSSSSVSNLRSPFSGLIICVTGLSKEARKQVMDATERLGGQYSPHLHPRCTHL
ncbi:hypothetical protein L1987_54597 [Smallanthus sonchifolius]|uniref:Uncharacterized protein n=1 Tax=Smallanthus sonchifolius TaxID=185202 RepID=A0ACB9E7W0_9ASTR|nr:hypothetical protein L1987_54597 [Smallanthus sonchifolius]